MQNLTQAWSGRMNISWFSLSTHVGESGVANGLDPVLDRVGHWDGGVGHKRGLRLCNILDSSPYLEMEFRGY